jgi:hypothetical protein
MKKFFIMVTVDTNDNRSIWFHRWDSYKNRPNYFNKYFWSEKEMRLKKLKRIHKFSNGKYIFFFKKIFINL